VHQSEGQIIGLKKYKRKVQAIEKILPNLCSNCRKIVEEALAHK